MKWNWHRFGIWAFATVFIVYMVAIPVVAAYLESLSPQKSAQALEDPTLAETVRLRTIEAIVTFIFFAVGASIGSFLNVIVYRMPRGESVVVRPSSCPICDKKIKGRDNIPILGWLLLNGRCRNCRVPISSRYPIVESIAATMFLVLFLCELISGGANIPVRPPNFFRGVVWIIFYTKWDLVGLYFFHCCALSGLFTWALIDIDRQRVKQSELLKPGFQVNRIPWSKICGVSAILCLLVYLCPHFIPVPWQLDSAFGIDTPKQLYSLWTALTGGFLGGALGWLAGLTTRATISSHATLEEEQDSAEAAMNARSTELAESEPEVMVEENRFSISVKSHTISAGIFAGLSVGWQATVGVWIFALTIRPVIHFLARIARFNEPPITVAFLLGYFTHLLVWRLLTVHWWPSYETTPAGWGIAAISLLMLMGLNWALPIRLNPMPENCPKATDEIHDAIAISDSPETESDPLKPVTGTSSKDKVDSPDEEEIR